MFDNYPLSTFFTAPAPTARCFIPPAMAARGQFDGLVRGDVLNSGSSRPWPWSRVRAHLALVPAPAPPGERAALRDASAAGRNCRGGCGLCQPWCGVGPEGAFRRTLAAGCGLAA